MRLWNVKLPATGSGPLKITGSGWKELTLDGAFSGSGQFVGRPLSYEGGFRYAGGRFTLRTTAASSFLDRDWNGSFDWRDGGWTSVVTDDKGSQIEARGVRYEGGGRLVWPYPLEGEARVGFSGEGTSWRVDVVSPQTDLLLAKGPLDLSGYMAGYGMDVSGRLGPVGFSGRWDDLQMSLDPVEMLVGRVAGRAVWNGSFSFAGAYTSPYVSFPINVVQKGDEWRGQAGEYGEFVWKDGIFDARVQEMPLDFLGGLTLSGAARWDPATGWSGEQRLLGDHLELLGELRGQSWRFAGTARTPLGAAPFSGMADGAGVRGKLAGADFSYAGGVFELTGRAELEKLVYQGDLSYSPPSFTGTAHITTPWLEADLTGKGPLYATTRGYLTGSGRLWPEPDFSGRLELPLLAGIQIAPQPVHVTGKRAAIGDGFINLTSPFDFSLSLPFAYQGSKGELKAKGDAHAGRLELLTPWGTAAAAGDWNDLSLTGSLNLPRLGRAELAGSADLYKLRYRLLADLPDAAGRAEVAGQGGEYSWSLSLQDKAASARGTGSRFSLSFNRFDSAFLGLPGEWNGDLAYDSGLRGDLSYAGPYGNLSARGYGTLLLEGAGDGYELSGYLNDRGLHAAIDLDLSTLGGRINLEGPWSALTATGEGEWRLPGAEPQPWKLTASSRTRKWQVTGPLSVSGDGLSYRGRLDWKEPLYGLSLTGEFAGDGASLSGSAELNLPDFAARLRFSHEKQWLLRARSPAGSLDLDGEELRLRLADLDSLGTALDLPLGGSLAGTVDLRRRQGSLSGSLRLAGESLGLVARPREEGWIVDLYDARRSAGLQLGLGRETYLAGLGAVQGRLQRGDGWRGQLVYEEDGLSLRLTAAADRLNASLKSPSQEVSAVYRDGRLDASFSGDLSGSGRLDLKDSSYDLQARYASPYAKASLSLRGVGSVWHGRGHLETHLGPLQSGPFTLEGSGSQWRFVWSAPLSLTAAGQGASLTSLSLVGEAPLGSPSATWGRVRSGLEYGGGGYAGQLKAGGTGWGVEVVGAGDVARLGGEILGFAVTGSIDTAGRLRVTAGGERTLARSRLKFTAGLGGSLTAPRVRADLQIEGEGEAEVTGFFEYERGWRATLQGPGLQVVAEPSGVQVKADDFDLRPFTGRDYVLEASGAGRIKDLRIDARIRGLVDGTDLRGWWDASHRAGELKGRIPDGRLELQADAAGWRLRIDHPRARGEIVYREGEWSGSLAADLPLASGGLRLLIDAGNKSVNASGYGNLDGELALGLSPLRLQGRMRGPGFSFAANLREDDRRLWAGKAELDLADWGGVLITGAGPQMSLAGIGGLGPLRGYIRSEPWSLKWSYKGQLPKNMGYLDAGGSLPGEWLAGNWKYAGKVWDLRASGAAVEALTEGARVVLKATGLQAELNGLTLAGLRISGKAEGPWSGIRFDLATAGLRLRGVWGREKSLGIEGWAKGKLSLVDGSWRGKIKVTGGELQASGSGPLPELRGRWRGHDISFEYPRLQVDGLSYDFERRAASGEIHRGDMLLVGEGRKLRAVYRLPEGSVTALLDLQTFSMTVDPDGAGTGSLGYRPEDGFSGEMSVSAPWGQLRVKGDGGLQIVWDHATSRWLPWGTGRLTIKIGDGWRLDYQGGKQVSLELSAGGSELSLEVQSEWGGGRLSYKDGWRGGLRIDGFPLDPLQARLSAEVRAEAGALASSGSLKGYAGELSYSLRAEDDSLLPRLESAALVVDRMRIEKLPSFLNKLPYASGSVNATFAYGKGMLAGRLLSEGLTVGEETYPVDVAVYWGGEQKTLEAVLGDSEIVGEWVGDDIRLSAEMSRLPLHFITGAWSGPLDGVGYWTGAARAHVRLDDIKRSYVVLVGEKLEFAGGGDVLRGSAVARYENGVFYLDKFDLEGKGSWRGSGYWGPEDADLEINIEDAVFTPVLGIFPQLRRLRPQATGSVGFTAKGQRAVLEIDDLDYSLAGVGGRVGRLKLVSDRGQVTVGGDVEIEKPYPGNFEISGEGSLKDLEVGLSGQLELPAIGKLDDINGGIHWPDWRVSLKAGDARLTGKLWPLSLRLSGELPVSLPDKYLQSGLVRSDLTFAYENGEYVLGGEAEVVRAVLSRPEGEREVVFKEKKYDFPLRFDRVRIYSNGGIIIQEPLAKGEGEGEVYLGGDLADPYLSGEVRAVRGDFLLGRHRFVVDDGWARFTPSGGLYPEIYILAHADIPSEDGDLQLYLETEGHFVSEQGRARLVLEPRIWALQNGEPAPYSQEQLLAMLALGGGTLVQGAADLAIQNFLIAQLEYELSKALGLDIFTLQTDLFGGGSVESTQFTIGKYLSPDLLLTYSINLQGQQAVGAEYRIDGLRLRVESEIGGDELEPLVKFSLLYAIRPDLDLILKLQTGEMKVGLEWRF